MVCDGWNATNGWAEQFVDFYYKTFDADRSQLANLYGPDSMLTFEASPHQGVGNIIQKLQVRLTSFFAHL